MKPLILSLFLLNCTNIKENKIHVICDTYNYRYEADVESIRRDGPYWIIVVDSKTSIRIQGDCIEK